MKGKVRKQNKATRLQPIIEISEMFENGDYSSLWRCKHGWRATSQDWVHRNLAFNWKYEKSYFLKRHI